MTEPLLNELSEKDRRGVEPPPLDVPVFPLPEEKFLRSDLDLPELSEVAVVRHFTRLSKMNYSVDDGFYPLGSCTMKYNPKVNEEVAGFGGLTVIHPYQPVETVQGALELMFGLQEYLNEITGMKATSLQPAAGAHGELTGIMMVKAYHEKNEGSPRSKIIVPDSAHGTNPATAAMCGYQVVTVPSDARGNVDLAALRAKMAPDVVGMMLTLPSTLGLFDPNILEIARIIHAGGGQLYGDGANMNALLGKAKPGDLGFDVIHLNLHKTFSTPHGGGGPGSGPVCVQEHLAPFLPKPVVAREMRAEDPEAGPSPFYTWTEPADSIGRVRSFYANFRVLVRAYAYIRTLGERGLREVAENAVLNANYLLHRLKGAYLLPYDRHCMHEVVLSGHWQKAKGVRTLDIAKRLIDYGFYPPTIYFPLIVDEALMIEPTETESLETLDAFADAMLAIAREVDTDPDLVKSAPHHTPVLRLDEATAARRPRLCW